MDKVADLANNQPAISAALLQRWDDGHADLPWRRTKDPYHIWVSEIMLQQTQIATVIGYYERWMAQFPTVEALASAEQSAVLKAWEGLGYYSRARNLHHAAQTVVNALNGEMPKTVDGLRQLKGIGDYTAGAIASIAYDLPAPILDGNVIRVLSRLTDLPDDVTQSATKKVLWQMAAAVVPEKRAGDFNQSLMELGQTVCSKSNPDCANCPLAALCLANQTGTQNERPHRPARKKTPHYDVAAGIIWNDDKQFLIAQRPEDGLLGGLWEFPGGKQEASETMPQTLVREIMEELAMEIEVGDLVTTVKHAFTHFKITLHAYHAQHLSGKPQHLGVADHAWVTLNELDQYAFGKADRKVIEALESQSRSLFPPISSL